MTIHTDPIPWPEPLCALVGTTATGKSDLAMAVAQRAGAEIVSVDSMLVYRGMDIGTAKPSAAERSAVVHHLIDCADPIERYDVQRYLSDVEDVLVPCESPRLLFTGGTGFYLKALTHGLFEGPEVNLEIRAELERLAKEVGSARLHEDLQIVDPESAKRIHPNDQRRVVRGLEVVRQTGRPLSDWQRQWRGEGGHANPGRSRLLLGLEVDRERLDQRIALRTRKMLDGGWAEEARSLRDGCGFGPTAVSALGYPEVLKWIDGESSREETETLINLRTRQFARRQRTWYRKFPDIHWIPAPENAQQLESAAEQCLRFFDW